MQSTESFQSHIIGQGYSDDSFFKLKEEHEMIEEITPYDQETFNKAKKCFLRILGGDSIDESSFDRVKNAALVFLKMEKQTFLEQKNKLQMKAIKHYKWNHGFIPCTGGICSFGLGLGPMATAFLVDEGAKAVFAAIAGYSFICIGLVALLYGCTTFGTMGLRTLPPKEEKLFSNDYESSRLCDQIKEINRLINCIESNDFRDCLRV